MKYDNQIALKREAARAWCEDHKREIDVGGLTINEAVDALLAGDLYRVDTMSAGYDMIIDAADESDALYAVADFAGRLRGTSSGHVVDEGLTRGWTAKLVTI
jgi:hypothetical protein